MQLIQVLASCEYAQLLMEREQLYEQLFQLVNSCGPPDYLTLQAILGMATFSSSSSSSCNSSNQRLCNIQPVRKLLHWLTVTEYENHDQQGSSLISIRHRTGISVFSYLFGGGGGG